MTFRHVDGKDVPAPGFYLHIEPGHLFMAAGMWHGRPEVLKDVRDAIVAHPGHWKRVVASRSFDLDESSEALKRPPRGYDPEHLFVEDLKRKSFGSSTNFAQKDVFSSDFLTRLAKACKQKALLMEFLCNAVGRPW